MFAVTGTNRVTCALDYEAMQRIIAPHHVSSRSEQSTEADAISFSDMLFNFAADEDGIAPSKSPSPDKIDPVAEHDPNVADQIRPIVEDDSDDFRNALKAHVLSALQMIDEDDAQLLRMKVMGYLRELGYDAAVCKTKWKSGGGVIAGEYEFLDVVDSTGDSPSRYLVDVDFRSEFALARPTGSYELGLQSLPRVFVGRSEELKAILRVMSDAVKRSLKSSGLLTPPWRKHQFLHNKWFSAPVSPPSFRADGVNCRAVIGFDVASVSSAAARRRDEVI